MAWLLVLIWRMAGGRTIFGWVVDILLTSVAGSFLMLLGVVIMFHVGTGLLL